MNKTGTDLLWRKRPICPRRDAGGRHHRRRGEAITSAPGIGGRSSWWGFGSFGGPRPAPPVGYNPKTGEEIPISEGLSALRIPRPVEGPEGRGWRSKDRSEE